MEIIHNTSKNKSSSLSKIKGGKGISPLQSVEIELLKQMTEAFTVINGGQFKKNRQIA